MISTICQSEGGFSDEKFTEVVDAIEKSYAEGGAPTYAGDLENETYKTILQSIRDFSTSEMSSK